MHRAGLAHVPESESTCASDSTALHSQRRRATHLRQASSEAIVPCVWSVVLAEV